MRPQQNRRMRGKNNNNNNNRRGSNPLSRNYESNGPDVKIRGNAQHIADKYAALARDAQVSGDRVMAENYLQHAEHYTRIILAAQAQMPQPVHREENFEDDAAETAQNTEIQIASEEPAASGEQPILDGALAEVALSSNAGLNQNTEWEDRRPRRTLLRWRTIRTNENEDEAAQEVVEDAANTSENPIDEALTENISNLDNEATETKNTEKPAVKSLRKKTVKPASKTEDVEDAVIDEKKTRRRRTVKVKSEDA